MKLLVTGLGRSGTKWLAKYLVACGYQAGHESSYFGGQTWRARGILASRDMRQGRLPDWEEVKSCIRAISQDWIEVNGYLLMHVPSFLAARVPVLHLVRDGRDQVRSVMARRKRSMGYIGQFGCPVDTLSYFGQLAYAWNARAMYLRSLRYLRFEDMLNNFSLLQGILRQYGVEPDYITWERERDIPRNVTPQHALPPWQEWTVDQRAEFDTVAAEAMRHYGYY